MSNLCTCGHVDTYHWDFIRGVKSDACGHFRCPCQKFEPKESPQVGFDSYTIGPMRISKAEFDRLMPKAQEPEAANCQCGAAMETQQVCEQCGNREPDGLVGKDPIGVIAELETTIEELRAELARWTHAAMIQAVKLTEQGDALKTFALYFANNDPVITGSFYTSDTRALDMAIEIAKGVK
jgi:hypothetical protein